MPRRDEGRGNGGVLVRVGLFLVLVTVHGCGGAPAPRGSGDTPLDTIATDTTPPAGHASLPDTKPDIHGVVTASEGVRIRIEENPHDATGSNKASLRIEPRTVIRRRTGEPAAAGDLVIGTRVSAWYEGPVMESYPLQALARVIVIEPDSL
jgi:hypothetical protein